MSTGGLLPWIGGLGLFTVLGSLSARKYGRPTLLTAMTAGLAAAGHALPWPLVLPAGFPGPFPVGALPLALALLPLCTVVEKFGQPEGHRGALFLTAGGALGALVLGWSRAAPPWTAGGWLAGSVAPETTPWIALAGLAGTLIGANTCVVVYHMTRVLGGERHPWMRMPLAILVGGLVETFVFLPLAYAGRDPLGPFLAGRASLWGLVAVAALPLGVLHRGAVGRRVAP